MPETALKLSDSHSFGKKAGLVTVIVPIYNAARYLNECLDSVSKQTYSDIEVLMVNDGSTDNSADICCRYEVLDSRFHLINCVNKGVSAARNTGIKISTGEYIYFIDADDEMHSRAVETLVAALNMSGADIALTPLDYGIAPSFFDLNVSTLSRIRIYDNYSLLEKGLYQSVIINSACGVLFRSSIFDGGLRFCEGRRYEDLDIFYKWILESRKIAYLPEKLYFYRKHSESFIQHFTPARLDVLDVTDEMLANISALGNRALEKAARDRRFSAHFNIWILLIANNIEWPEIERRCLEVIYQERRSEILNPRVRLKNKLGALASYGGRSLVGLLLRFIS